MIQPTLEEYLTKVTWAPIDVLTELFQLTENEILIQLEQSSLKYVKDRGIIHIHK